MSDKDDHVSADLEVPVSAGVPRSAQFLMACAVLIVFMQGAFVVIAAVYGRVWPALNSVKVQLP
jgi:hypothetical protein